MLHNKKIVSAIVLIILAFGLVTALSPAVVASSHGEELCGISEGDDFDTETVYVTGEETAEIPYEGDTSDESDESDDEQSDEDEDDETEDDEIERCEIDVDDSHLTFEPTPIEQAIIAVDPGGEVVIEEHPDFGSTDNNDGHRGAVIGTDEGGVLEGTKEITIRGEEDGIPVVRAPRDEEAPFVFSDNSQDRIEVSNLVLAESEKAAVIKSRSNVLLEDISMDGSLEAFQDDSVQYIDIQSTISDVTQPSGAIIRTSNIYYQSSVDTDSDIVNSPGLGEAVNFEIFTDQDSSAIDVENYVFDRISPVASNEPVITGKFDVTDAGAFDPDDDSFTILVDQNNGDDNTIVNPIFESLDSALKATSRDQVIDVREGSEPYEVSAIEGIGVEEDQRLTIRGYDNHVPEVEGLSIDYPGVYNIENIHISGNVDLGISGVTADLSNNYWMDGEQDSETILNNIIRGNTDSDTVTISPICEDENCNNLAFDGLDDFCMALNEEVTDCDTGQSSNLDIEVGLFEGDSDTPTDLREGYVMMDPDDIDEQMRVQISVLQSDSTPDVVQTIQPGQDDISEEVEDIDGEERALIPFEAVFSNLRVNSQMRPIVFQPTVAVSVESVEGPDFGQSVVTTQLEENVELESLINIGPDDLVFGVDERGDSSVIIDGDTEGQIETQNTRATRFSASDGDTAFRDDSVPPISVQDGGTVDGAEGMIEDFGNIRSDNSFPTVIEPSGSLDVGMSFENLPPAQDHILYLEYAYPAENDIANNIDLSLVDESNSAIYTGRDDDIETIEPTAGIDAFDSDQPESDVDIVSKTIELHPLETSYISNNGEIYLTMENTGFTDIGGDVTPQLLLYNATVRSTDYASVDEEEGDEFDGGGEVNTEPLPGDIDVEINVLDATFNSEYDTYDMDPIEGEQIEYELILENEGNEPVTDNFIIEDTHVLDSGSFPDDQTSETGEITEIIAETGEVTVDDSDQYVERFETNWGAEDFGLHEVRVDREDIDDEQGNIGFNAYVLQSATPEIVDIDMPDEHLAYDNFNAEITIQNIGDLSGEIDVDAELSPIGGTSADGWWSVEETVELPEGDTRSRDESEEVSVFYARSNHPNEDSSEVFNRREYAPPSEVFLGDRFENEQVEFDGTSDYYRPNAPFSTEPGDNIMNVFVESTQNPDSDLSHTESQEIYLDQLQLTDFNVDVNPNELNERAHKPDEDEATVYASAWPYLHPSYAGLDNLRPFSNEGPERGGEGTMFSRSDPDDVDDRLVNRGAFPLNRENPSRISYTSEPEDNYMSQFFSTRMRACNDHLITDESQLPTSEGSESDVGNVFIAFSAEDCNDINRFTEVHGMRFEGTTQFQRTDSRFTGESQQNVTLEEHPDPYDIDGVNPNTFEELDGQESVMFAHVRIVNPIDIEHTATARVEVVTDQQIDGQQVVGFGGPAGHSMEIGSDRFDDNVVGSAAVRIEPEEEVEFSVPLVIRNNEGADGVHELSVRQRATAEGVEDYMEFDQGRTDEPLIRESPITGEEHERFTIPIQVETYGDAVLTDLEPSDEMSLGSQANDPVEAQRADARAYSVCREDPDDSVDSREEMDGNFLADQGTYSESLVEGLNPRSGISDEELGVERSIGECMDTVGEDDETVSIEATYRNYGGDTIEIRPELIAEHESRNQYTSLHRENAHATGDRFFADYSNDDDTAFDAETWSERPGEIELEPGEEQTVTFERSFQEPGLYHLRVAPCRNVHDEGPQHYNLEGFTGIPETIDPIHPSTDPGWWTTTRHGIDRLDYDVGQQDNYNQHSTPEMENSVFQGSRGCALEVSSVFIYDQQQPVADFRVGDSDSTVKDPGDSEQTRAQTVDQTTDSGITADEGHETGDPEFEVHEGGMLFFDGSSYDCEECYDRDHFEPFDGVETPDDDPTQPLFRNSIQDGGSVFSHRMSTASTRITGVESPQNNLGLTSRETSGPGMDWTIDGEPPNFGHDDFCDNVNQDDVDEHCYMEAFEDFDSGMEVVAHRFADPGEDTVRLEVQDDADLTRGDGHTNVTTATVNVVDDTEDPSVTFTGDSFNDLTYANTGEDQPVYHRNEDVIEYDTLDNMESQFSNTYEGTRYCFETTVSDDILGISQDAWYDLDDRTLITDDGSYDGSYDGVHMDVDRSETRDGDRRCVVFEEAGQERQQTFEYEAWDFGENSETDDVDVDIEHDGEAPELSGLDHSYGDHFFWNSQTDSYVWAANSGQNYEGGTVTYEADASDDGTGVACLDLRAAPANDYCNSIDDYTESTFTDTYTAEQLEYTSSGTESEDVIATNWHSNEDEDTIEGITVEYDTTNPDEECTPGNCHNEDDDLGNSASDTTGSSPSASSSGSASAETCVTFDPDGYDGGVGLSDWSHSGDSLSSISFSESGSEFCIEASASASASASCTASCSVSCSCSAPSCGCDSDSDSCSDSCSDDDDEYDDDDVSATITVTDYHGNSETETISAYAEADAEADVSGSYSDDCDCESCSSCDDGDGD